MLLSFRGGFQAVSLRLLGVPVFWTGAGVECRTGAPGSSGLIGSIGLETDVEKTSPAQAHKFSAIPILISSAHDGRDSGFRRKTEFGSQAKSGHIRMAGRHKLNASKPKPQSCAENVERRGPVTRFEPKEVEGPRCAYTTGPNCFLQPNPAIPRQSLKPHKDIVSQEQQDNGDCGAS